ncbi:MAG TPA: pantoate--beta-alanine ligase [Cyanobacteria bacterium UBA9579]|nr:pantoate--beta-alanine ligase [Cyanobacteria bacterium UBA9579]
MEIISTIAETRKTIQDWKKQGLTVGFVPTMGALHIGHESLIKKARQECDKVIVSIFVNPIQFGPNEDYNRYPRQLDSDTKICINNKADLIFAPTVEEMYPEKEHLTKVCPPEFFQNKLCGNSRPGHFDGVATVVLKLFNIIQPDKAYFGQKDAQQLIIIKKTCRDLSLPVEIVSCPIIRDPDGVACSSRNAYLSAESRQKALSLYKTLKKTEELYLNGISSKNEIFNTAKKCLESGIKLEYLEANNLDTLEPVDKIKPNTLLAIAARVNEIRLIDNIIIE